MLKTRIIGVLILKNGMVVQSIQFKKFLPIGSLDISVEYLNKWGIDEIIILDIDATKDKRSPNFSLIKSAASFSETPISVGGGISSLSDIESLLRIGVDKVVINTKLISDPSLIQKGAYQFGSQCMIASIDAIKVKNEYLAYNHFKNSMNYSLKEIAKIAEENGAGEIFLNSVERDGMKIGYDLKMASEVSSCVSIPIIICGGVGRPSHLVEGAKKGIDAVAAGNFFHFTEMSVITAKQFLLKNRCNVRLDSYTNYSNAIFDISTERPVMINENILEKLRFTFIPEEKI